MSANDNHYALNWSNHTLHLKKAFDSLLTANEFVDVTLSCEGRKISAHKMLLSACSTYFRDLFRDNPCQHPIIIFRDVKFQDLKYLLTFMYSGEVSMPTENLDSFLRTAELLHISGLSDEQNRLISTESEHEKPDKSELLHHTRSLLKRHAEAVQERVGTSTNRINVDGSTSEENSNKKSKLGKMDFNVSEIKQEEVEVLNTEHEEFTFDDPLSIDNVDPLRLSRSQDFANVQNLLNDVAVETTEEAFELLSEKSKVQYEKEFRLFDDWRREKNICGVDEQVVLAYFHSMKQSFKPSTLLTKYSMLRAKLKVFEHVDISRFSTLIRYLKENGRGFKRKKAKALEKIHIARFLVEAPDELYLLLKIVLIFGIAGACSCEELCKLKMQDIEDKGSYLTIRLPDTKTKKLRKFVLINEAFGVHVLNIYKRYMSLRPKHVAHGRFLLSCINLKCTVQPVGVNTISKVPKQVATYLQLADPGQYSGYSMRRSQIKLMSVS